MIAVPRWVLWMVFGGALTVSPVLALWGLLAVLCWGEPVNSDS